MTNVDREMTVSDTLIKIVSLKDEWLIDIDDPENIIKCLREKKIGGDIFTFWQRYPDTKPKYHYYMEWDNWAVLEVSTYDHWFRKQINLGARSAINKSKKKGIEVRVVPLTEEFIKGLMDIYNETQVRQGRTFKNYGINYETLERQLSKEIHRTDLIGAYYENELVGYLQQVYAGECAHPFGGLTKIAHRDKAINNSLLAKSVEICAEKKVRFIVYGNYDYGSGGGPLADFKRHNGFEKVNIPKYYIPLTIKGNIGLRLRAHHGIIGMMTPKMKAQLIALRKKWHSRKQASSK